MNELKKFLDEMVNDAKNDKEFCDLDYRFNLIRWSQEEPYWCVLACTHGTGCVDNLNGVTGIGGDFCIGKNEDFQEVLTVLADSGWKVEIHESFWNF